MAEFSEVVRQWKRMCQYYTARAGNDHDACAICKFEGDGSNCLAVYEDAEVDTAEVERVVMAWAAEHPEPKYPTWWEWLENMGIVSKAKSEYSEIFDTICVGTKMFDPIPADIAEKLGIEPKEDA